ncbi:hypothetical protein Droror1_Dr00014817 [Drosera rotundifolia]
MPPFITMNIFASWIKSENFGNFVLQLMKRLHIRFGPGLRLLEDVYNSHLVECEGELPVVFLGALGKWVQIFRLIDSHWVEVDKLDNQMLFLNRSSTFCVAAPSPKGETGSTFLDFMAKASSFTRSAQRSITLLETMPRSMISMVQERCWVQHGFFLIHNCKLEYNFTRKSPSILCQDSRDMY